MLRLAPLDRSDVPEQLQEHYDLIQIARGQDPSDRRVLMPDVFRILLRNPELASAVAQTPTAIRAGTTVSQVDQEIVVLTVSREAMAPLQWDVHVLRGRDVGLSDRLISGIRDHNLEGTTDREQLLVHFAASVFHQCCTDALYKQVVDAIGEQAAVELTVLVGFTTMMIQIVTALNIPSGLSVDIPLPPAAQANTLWSEPPSLRLAANTEGR